MSIFVNRRQQLADRLTDHHALLVSHPINVTYLTGFSGEASWLLVPAQGRGRPVLVSDGRFTQQLAEECPGLDVEIRPPERPLVQAAAAVVRSSGAVHVACESTHLSLADAETLATEAPSVTWSPETGLVENLRVRKDADEIAAIRLAITIAERALAMFLALLRRDDNEKDLADAMEGYLRRAGARCAAFPTIVAVGPRSALPHAPVGSVRVSESPFLLLDWGANASYHSDLTRILLTEECDPEQIRFSGVIDGRQVETSLGEVYTVVQSAQRAALAAIGPGVTAGAVDAAARQVIESAGFGAYFTHALGHGLGLQVHERPFLRPSATEVLAEGMVMTVEPGIYLPGLGGVRIEDDVLVTADGCERLTHVAGDTVLRTGLT